ncbi:MAG TPA: ASCH domain-containing protein [Kofleriaceae bacterium]|nr:ASCH domain-containing protein [Kofleriaceae bacterium]
MADARVRGLVLSRNHEVLLVDGRVPEAIGPWPPRPLLMLSQHVREALGLELPAPVGSLVPADGSGPRDFAFVVDKPSSIDPRQSWVRLADAAADDTVWRTYVECMLGGWEPPRRDLDVFAFGDAGEMAASLVHLVTCGRKRGTAAWLRSYEREGSPIPVVGSLSVVTDGFGLPRCVIRTEEVRRLRFGDVGEDAAVLEGEGDLTLADWREGHLRYFEREAAGMQMRFDDDEEIMLERFRVVTVIGRSDPLSG